MRSIPIVKKSFHMVAFRDLPILFTEDYTELSKAYLEKEYNRILNTSYDFSRLHFSYWRDYILKTKLERNRLSLKGCLTGFGSWVGGIVENNKVIKGHTRDR